MDLEMWNGTNGLMRYCMKRSVAGFKGPSSDRLVGCVTLVRGKATSKSRLVLDERIEGIASGKATCRKTEMGTALLSRSDLVNGFYGWWGLSRIRIRAIVAEQYKNSSPPQRYFMHDV